MMKLSTLMFLQLLLAGGAKAGLIRDLMHYGQETVEEVEEVGAEAMDLAEEAGEMVYEVTADIAGQSFHQRQLDSCEHWPSCYKRPWWCTGSEDPEGYCIEHFGIYAKARKWHHCYNNPYDDCTCINDNYEVVNGECVEKFCAEDPDQFCIDQYGLYGKPKWWKRDCVQDAYDCTCQHGYSVRNHECMKCADEPHWWCKEQYGIYGIPRHDRHCFIYPSDCMCMDGYVLDDGECKENPCLPGYSLVHGICHEDLDGCAWDPWWYCMSICGPKGIPRTGMHCIKTVNDCMCEEGSWPYDGICIEEPPGGFGDPHFVTFHGHEFQFHGECDLVLVKAPTHDLDIHVRTTIRYDYSFISQAAIRLGEHIFEVGSWGEYQLDGMATIDLPVMMDGHPITVNVIDDVKKKYKFSIHLDDGKGIDIVSFKDYVSVKLVNSTEDDFFDAVGLMGHYHGGDMMARDGETKLDENPIAFGQEWQVRPRDDGQLFSDAREPVYPQKCRMPAANAIQARDRKLGEAEISPEDAKAACAKVEANRRADCYHDVRRSRDLEMAIIYL